MYTLHSISSNQLGFPGAVLDGVKIVLKCVIKI